MPSEEKSTQRPEREELLLAVLEAAKEFCALPMTTMYEELAQRRARLSAALAAYEEQTKTGDEE